MIRALPTRIRLGACTIVAVTGAPPNRAVAWLATNGTITPLADRTDAHGRCFAIAKADNVEGILYVQAVYGA